MSGLNASQQRYVMAVLAEINKHLDSIESVMEVERLSAEGKKTGFSADEYFTLREFLAETRADVGKLISQLVLVHPETGVSARWSLHTHLEFADVEFQELSASKLRGYGPLDEHAYAELQHSVDGLRRRLRDLLREF